MRNGRTRGWPVALLACALLACASLLSSCARGEAHLTIRADGAAELSLDLSMDDGTLGLIGKSGLMDELAERLKADGMDVRTYEQDGRKGVTASRRLNLRDMARETVDLPDGIAVERSRREHLFYTTERAAVTVDMDRLLAAGGGKEWAQKLSGMNRWTRMVIESQLDLNFALTAPIRAHSSNADKVRDGGRTLVWQLPLLGTKRFEAAYNVPNVRAIACAAAGLALLALAAFFALRAWRGRRARLER